MTSATRHRRSPLEIGIGALAMLPALLIAGYADAAAPKTATPIAHVVVLYQENVSFDHYFATYPKAQP